jgi:cellulose synthase/poly-beta-1,6-N-acetylglucosamine synthase-like glycosyltransferase
MTSKALAPFNDRLSPAKETSDSDRQRMNYKLAQLRDGSAVLPVVVRQYEGGVQEKSLLPTPQRVSMVSSFMGYKDAVLNAIKGVQSRRAEEEKKDPIASIVAFIPAYNEPHIDKTIETLLKQSRAIDLIAIVVNNTTDDTVKIAQRYADVFPQIVVHDVGEMADGKVGALNFAWRRYASMGQFTFVLGVDADVICDEEMVKSLEIDMLTKPNLAGVRAKYSFLIPEDGKRRQHRWIMNQRHEFGMVEMKAQLHGGRADILGGQATLFSSEALNAAAQITDGKAPWDSSSFVEDAELTRTFQFLKLRTMVSSDARAWVGPMFNGYAWDKQRNKWNTGHLKDMIKTFRPVLDRKRWMSQIGLGWNLLIRVLFVTLLVSSISLNKFVFNPIWLIPIGMSIFQAFLVACRLPNRRAGEILRAIMFIPGEVYLWKQLAVWVSSISKVIFDIRHNLWQRQSVAESAKRTRSISAWMIILLAALIPTVVLGLVARLISNNQMITVLNVGWWTLKIMTVSSVIVMTFWIVRILRKFTTLKP